MPQTNLNDGRKSENTEKVQDPALLPPLNLPDGISSRFVDTSPLGLKFHILESMPPKVPTDKRPPLILLVHGFPNLAYDWRYVIPQLAAAGYYVVAFDQRGFGRTHSADLQPLAPHTFRPLTMIRDVVILVHALGYTSVHTMVGHDLGAATASFCTLARNDMVKSLVLMSHPFGGAPKVPFGVATSDILPLISSSTSEPEPKRDPDMQKSLLQLQPPRKHYKWYNTSDNANVEWSYPQGRPLHDFLRGYFHLKSADHSAPNPHPLRSWTADELSVMPHYYVMRDAFSMRENIELDMSAEPKDVLDGLGSTVWLSEADLEVYTAEWSRTTFHDALRWYRTLTDPELATDVQIFASKKINVPTKYVSGIKDWGTYQVPGALEAMEKGQSVEPGLFRGTVLLQGAGHWPQMEQPGECVREILSLANSI